MTSKRSLHHGSGPAPLDLRELSHRIAWLWTAEPTVHAPARQWLLRDLADLEATVDRLLVRSQSGHRIAAHHVRACCDRYFDLAASWPEYERAA